MVSKSSKPRKVKCPLCGKFNEKALTVLDNQRYYCEDCYKKKKQESQDYKDLYAYICELYEIDKLEGLMLKQIKKFKEEFGYSYKGMKTTLDFFFHIETNNTPDYEMGIGIIPFAYKKAYAFYAEKVALKKKLESGEVDLDERTQEVKINRKDMREQEAYRDVVHIDIEDL